MCQSCLSTLFFDVLLLFKLQTREISLSALLNNMNLEDNLYPPFFNNQQSLNQCYNIKHEQNDKTTHQYPPNEYPQRHQDQFILHQPFRPSSFFFTPTSPRHFDIGNQSTAKSDQRNIPHGASICEKMSFKELEQKQESENEDCCEEQRDVQLKKVPNRSIKNAKGLRNLSESVYMIVSEMGKTKYKLVAQRLISDIIQNGEYFDKTKDEHNVKRRVYDALNVLIAANILQKQGKEVLCNEPYQRGRKNMVKFKNTRQMMERQRLQLQLKKKGESIEQKRMKLQKLKEKKANISKIIYRNKNEYKKNQNILNFPLISTCIEHDKISLLRDLDQQVIFKFGYRPHLYGDVDLILLISDEPTVKLQHNNENIYNVIEKDEDIEHKLPKNLQRQQYMESKVKLEES